MDQPQKIAKAGKRVGKKVLATDAAQGVVEAVVDKLEEFAVDKADDVAEAVKDRAAKAGGRSPKRATSGSRKKTGAKKSTAKKSTAKKSTARKAAKKS